MISPVSWNTVTTAVVAMPNLLDPMYWLGANGVFGHAVLPGILLIVFVETGLLFPLLPGESLLFRGGRGTRRSDRVLHRAADRPGTVQEGGLALLQAASCDGVARVLREVR